MIYENPLEERWFQVREALAIAVLNDWEFDRAILEDELREIEKLLEEEDL